MIKFSWIFFLAARRLLLKILPESEFLKDLYVKAVHRVNTGSDQMFDAKPRNCDREWVSPTSRAGQLHFWGYCVTRLLCWGETKREI